jgi:excisionase family DNA binding protein
MPRRPARQIIAIAPPVAEQRQVPRKKAYYIEEAAELLSLGKSLVLRLIDDGHLQGKRIYGRVVVSDAELDRFLADPEPVLKAGD